MIRNRINPFILAHGASAGPLMRPLLTGIISGTAAGGIVAFAFDRLHDVVPAEGHTRLIVFIVIILYCVVSGILYGAVYRRAANDRRGGWIFGASTGFILWMLDPIIWAPWLGQPPVFTGSAGVLFLLAHIAHGTLMGAFYPWVHSLFCRELKV